MQLSKKLMSYLSAALVIIGLILAGIHQFTDCTATATTTCPAANPIVSDILLALGAISTVIRGLMNDFPASSDPVINAAATAGAVAGADAARKATS